MEQKINHHCKKQNQNASLYSGADTAQRTANREKKSFFAARFALRSGDKGVDRARNKGDRKGVGVIVWRVGVVWREQRAEDESDDRLLFAEKSPRGQYCHQYR